MATSTVTIGTLDGQAASVSSSGGPLRLQTTAKDAQGNATGVQVLLSSSNTAIAKVTTVEQQGAAPAAVIGVAPGTATITATASDNSGATATLAVTVT